MVSRGESRVAGRPLHDEEVPTSLVSSLCGKSVKLRQRKLFEMCVQVHQENIDAPTQEDEEHRSTESFPWGDRVWSGSEVETDDMFRLLSHNVNGLSMSSDKSELRNFANSIAEKSVSLFGLQETNRNFERRHVLESFHSIIKSVSSHHYGAVASARMEWDHDYQPGGTAISVRNQ